MLSARSFVFATSPDTVPSGNLLPSPRTTPILYTPISCLSIEPLSIDSTITPKTLEKDICRNEEPCPISSIFAFALMWTVDRRIERTRLYTPAPIMLPEPTTTARASRAPTKSDSPFTMPLIVAHSKPTVIGKPTPNITTSTIQFLTVCRLITTLPSSALRQVAPSIAMTDRNPRLDQLRQSQKITPAMTKGIPQQSDPSSIFPESPSGHCLPHDLRAALMGRSLLGRAPFNGDFSYQAPPITKQPTTPRLRTGHHGRLHVVHTDVPLLKQLNRANSTGRYFSTIWRQEQTNAPRWARWQ